ncbi:MAG: histidine phosphatase family protein [Lactobacillus sp.]|jgi:probable phosphoglycerate mutase|nr:histidine phosphatase family protein [Lactobacillus sp.]MCI1481356.1 histidine phosphatase family protein [Lactobacillus sp.]
MEIYFVRHGKTEWNLAGRFQGGHGDSPLLPQSLADIKKLGHYLRGTEFAAIYASPLPRAYQTACGIRDAMGSQLPVIKDERLREFNLGKLEGMTFKEAAEKFPVQVKNFWDAPDKYDPTELAGESYPQIIARGKSFARAVAAKYPYPDDKVLAVSHGAALCAIMGGLLGYPLAELRKHGGLGNTSLTILATDDQGQSFQKVVWNQTDYLGRKLSATGLL